MKKTIIYKNLTATLVLLAMLFFCLADGFVFGMLGIICLSTAAAFSEKVEMQKKEWETILHNSYDNLYSE